MKFNELIDEEGGAMNKEEEVKKILENVCIASRELCAQISKLRPLFEPKVKQYCPISPYQEVDACDYDTETRSCSQVCEPKADESRLLTVEEILEVSRRKGLCPIVDTMGIRICQSVAQAQRDLTASIKDAEINKLKQQLDDCHKGCDWREEEYQELINEHQKDIEQIFDWIENSKGHISEALGVDAKSYWFYDDEYQDFKSKHLKKESK
jgi:transposase